MKLEACISTHEEAQAAVLYGFDRVELCSALSIGGITPSLGLIEKCCSEVKTETHVMIRPRGGNFVYSDNEIEVMTRDIKLAASAGATGVVLGVLKHDGSFDREKNKTLSCYAHDLGLETTFHRAIDTCQDPFEALDQLIELSFARLLTSGQAVNAAQGINQIEEFCRRSSGKIQIMAGSGINGFNAPLIKEKGVDALHFSITKVMLTDEQMGGSYEIDHDKIKSILSAIDD